MVRHPLLLSAARVAFAGYVGDTGTMLVADVIIIAWLGGYFKSDVSVLVPNDIQVAWSEVAAVGA